MRSLLESRVGGLGSTFGRFGFPLFLRPQVSGFSLVEVIIAMGIAAFCLIAMLGLIPSGLKQVKVSSEQTAATAILAAVATDIRNTPSGSEKSLAYGIALPTTAGASITTVNLYLNEDGKPNTSATSARYAIKASLVSSNNASGTTSGNLVIWWPAAASLGNSQGSVETVVIYNQNQ